MNHPEVIKIVCDHSQDGFSLLNKSDFDPSIHKEWQPVQPKPAAVSDKKVK